MSLAGEPTPSDPVLSRRLRPIRRPLQLLPLGGPLGVRIRSDARGLERDGEAEKGGGGGEHGERGALRDDAQGEEVK